MNATCNSSRLVSISYLLTERLYSTTHSCGKIMSGQNPSNILYQLSENLLCFVSLCQILLKKEKSLI